MTTPLPKELAMFAASGKQLDDLLYIVRSYGAAEYKRGIEDAKQVCKNGVGYYYPNFPEAAGACMHLSEQICKLGEKS